MTPLAPQATVGSAAPLVWYLLCPRFPMVEHDDLLSDLCAHEKRIEERTGKEDVSSRPCRHDAVNRA